MVMVKSTMKVKHVLNEANVFVKHLVTSLVFTLVVSKTTYKTNGQNHKDCLQVNSRLANWFVLLLIGRIRNHDDFKMSRLNGVLRPSPVILMQRRQAHEETKNSSSVLHNFTLN